MTGQDELSTSLLADISRQMEQVLDSVARVAEATVAIVQAARAAAGTPRRGDLAPLRRLVAEVLRRHQGFAAGAGVVLAPDVLADAPRCIEWWWAAGQGFAGRRSPGQDRGLVQLEVDLDPESAEFYDYTTTEWYREPLRTGKHSIAGPYVDYICTHQYTFTVSVPVVCAGSFAGVAAADILAEQVERMAAPGLSRLDRPAVLASAAGRIIASNTGSILPGMLLAHRDAAAKLRPVNCLAATQRGHPEPPLPWTLHSSPGSATALRRGE